MKINKRCTSASLVDILNIVGDDKYYLNRKINTKNKFLMLHAYKIKFMINDLKYNFKAPYNKNFKFFLNKSL